jgi:hypothetical protein
MTAKEKAGELIKKYAVKLPTQYNNRIDETSGVKIWDYNIDLAKQCALIAVDEIIKVVGNNSESHIWIKVKQEIKKI